MRIKSLLHHAISMFGLQLPFELRKEFIVYIDYLLVYKFFLCTIMLVILRHVIVRGCLGWLRFQLQCGCSL
jgi:hypothetical protein